MQVAQLPASQEKGGRRPPRRPSRAACRRAGRAPPSSSARGSRSPRRKLRCAAPPPPGRRPGRPSSPAAAPGSAQRRCGPGRRRDPERRLDEVHERTRPAHVAVGLQDVRSEVDDRRPGEEPAVASKWWRTPEPLGLAGAQAGERIVEDHRAASRFAYSRRTGRCVVASTLLVIAMTGVMPLPPQKARHGPRVCGQNTPAGLVASMPSPSARLSRNQFETRPPAPASR